MQTTRCFFTETEDLVDVVLQSACGELIDLFRKSLIELSRLVHLSLYWSALTQNVERLAIEEKEASIENTDQIASLLEPRLSKLSVVAT